MRSAAARLLLLAALPIGAGCPAKEAPPPAEAPAPAPAAPPAAAPAAATPTKTSTSSFDWAPEPKEVCTYQLKDVLTETLGDQLSAGHEVVARYSLRAEAAKGGGLSYLARVEHVHVKGKREAYAVDLDAQDRGDMVRVQGGADTLLLTDAILYFALLDRPVTFEVGLDGRVTKVLGGEAIREAFLALFPPKPRKDPHYQGQVQVRLSDDALVRRLLPFAAIAPAQGGLQPAKTLPAKEEIQRPEYPARALTATRLRVRDGNLLLEEKRALAPTDAEAEVPARKGLPEITLQAGQERTTVELTPGDPCFVRAAHQSSVTRRWRGQIEDEAVTTAQKRTSTLLYERN